MTLISGNMTSHQPGVTLDSSIPDDSVAVSLGMYNYLERHGEELKFPTHYFLYVKLCDQEPIRQTGSFRGRVSPIVQLRHASTNGADSEEFSRHSG